jgi:triphosphoribosyl-dephospho-CoA synthase
MRAATIPIQDQVHLAPRDAPSQALLLARFASDALVAEAELTPKPALADRRGRGAHTDLSLEIMLRSARALEPFFAETAFLAAGRRPDARLRAELGRLGRRAEKAMLEATGGANAHRGALWSLGLLTAAASMHPGPGTPAETIARTAARIARFVDPDAPARPLSHGLLVRRIYGAHGARGEARAGFPHVLRLALPVLRMRRQVGAPPEVARIDALLALMSRLDDTCLLYRGGPVALRAAKRGARQALRDGGAATTAGTNALFALDRSLLALCASPGGSADLLAAALFLDALGCGLTQVESPGITRFRRQQVWK